MPKSVALVCEESMKKVDAGDISYNESLKEVVDAILNEVVREVVVKAVSEVVVETPDAPRLG